MAEFGLSIVGLIKAIENMVEMRDRVGVSEDTYVISPDHEATETEGPYPPYCVLQEFGWTGGEPSPYMRPALSDSANSFSKIVGAVAANHSFIDDDPGNALLKAAAKFIQERAKAHAPVDTGELAFGIEGRGIFVEKVEGR